VLQLANSAAWGPPLDEADPHAATQGLGLLNVKRTLLLAHGGYSFREAEAAGFDAPRLWRHARKTSHLARLIATAEQSSPELVKQAATAGLLHNLGKIALVANQVDRYRLVMERQRHAGVPAWEAEQQVFGATHGEVGGCLLGLWGLPMPVIEAVALHHHPTCFLSNNFSPLTAVHVANGLLAAPDLDAARARLDLNYLAALQLDHRLPAWWTCRESLDQPQAAV
jgi:HD-like signal output (HDOD) protein